MKKELSLYEQDKLEPITGETLRPGGFVLTRKAIALCHFSPGAKILDIGCGTGATVHFLRQEYGFDAVGVDSSAIMLQKAKARNASLPLIKGSGENLPLPDQAFDGILMECTFTLMENHKLVLTESNRVLKGQGKLIISDFYYRRRPGILTKEYYEKMLTEHGFRLNFWEDHSQLLVQLVVSSILQNQNYGDILWQCLLTKRENKDLTREEVKAFKPGYFLLIAEKNSAMIETSNAI
ncbi:MAG: methyltransferase domain-containing protein [Firmicutes bacterium]|nr:methyltransferase domain-containing protein [Bacillota bacterium]